MNNKDIQTLIEEASKENHKGSFNSDSIWLQDQSFQAGAHFALSLFKWRKVSEVLPEERTDINIKSNGCIYSSRMVRIDDVPIFFISGVSLTVKLEDITEWMPIPQNE